MCFFAVIGLTLTQLKYNFPDSPKIQSRSESLRYFASHISCTKYSKKLDGAKKFEVLAHKKE